VSSLSPVKATIFGAEPDTQPLSDIQKDQVLTSIAVDIPGHQGDRSRSR
jgi:hypothetical protein